MVQHARHTSPNSPTVTNWPRMKSCPRSPATPPAPVQVSQARAVGELIQHPRRQRPGERGDVRHGLLFHRTPQLSVSSAGTNNPRAEVATVAKRDWSGEGLGEFQLKTIAQARRIVLPISAELDPAEFASADSEARQKRHSRERQQFVVGRRQRRSQPMDGCGHLQAPWPPAWSPVPTARSNPRPT